MNALRTTYQWKLEAERVWYQEAWLCIGRLTTVQSCCVVARLKLGNANPGTVTWLT